MSSAFALVLGVPTIEVDPDSWLDYSFVWDAWLDGDTLASASWAITPAGPTLYGEGINASAVTIDGKSYAAGKVATVWVKGLAARVDYTVTCSIVSAAGRHEQRSARIKARER